MEESSIERIRKHLGQGYYLELENDECQICGKSEDEHPKNEEDKSVGDHEFNPTIDKFQISQLPIEEEWKLMYVFGKIKDRESPIITQWDEASFIYLDEIGYLSLKDSPDFKGLNDEELHQFVKNNKIPLFFAMLQANDSGANKIKTADRRALETAKRLEKLSEKHGK